MRTDDGTYNFPEDVLYLIATIAICSLIIYCWLAFSNYKAFKPAYHDVRLSLDLAEDESIIRIYKCAEVDLCIIRSKDVVQSDFKTSKYGTAGRMVVTNRRVMYIVDGHQLPLFSGKSNNLIWQQIRIEDVCGIDSYTSFYKIPLIYPLSVVLIGILSLFAAFNLENGAIPTSIVILSSIIMGGVWFYLIHMKVDSKMLFGIRTRNVNYSIYVSEYSRGYADNYQYYCCPAEDFENMTLEIGAIILDLQKYGDDAIQKWKRQQPREEQNNESNYNNETEVDEI